MHKPRARLIIAILIVVGIAGLANAQEDDAWYMGKPIKDIQFKGLNSTRKSELDPVVNPYIGKKFNDDLFLELQSKIYELDYFSKIEPEAIPSDDAKDGVIIRFIVVERSIVDAIRFEGNKGVKSFDLQSAIALKVGDILRKTSVMADEEALRNLYIEKGYSQVQLRSEERAGIKGVALVFVIDEGKQVTVKKIYMKGNDSFSEKSLKKAIQLKEPSLLSPGAYQESLLNQSKDSLLAYYRDRGYIDAVIADPEKQIEPDDKHKKDNVNITFVITEGKQYTYAGVSFEGNQIFNSAKLSALVLQKKDQIYNDAKFKLDMNRVRNIYYENGYVFSQISVQPERDEDKRTIGFKIQITERERAHIANISVDGNLKTKEYVIRREIPLEQGDIFSKGKIEDGLRNLYNLQYFSDIVPDVRPVSEQLVDIALHVVEQNTTNFNVGLSYVPNENTNSNYPPIGAFVRMSDNNFMGNGQTLSANVEASPDTQSLTFGFTEKWLMDKRWLGNVSLSIDHDSVSIGQDSSGVIFNDGVPDPYNSYEEYEAANFLIPDEYLMYYDSFTVSLGGTTGYVFKLPQTDLGLRVGVNFSLENVFYDASVYRPYDSDVRDNHENWQFSDTLVGYAYLDGLDLSFNPSRGYVFTNKFTLSGYTPYESQQYMLNDVKAEGYLTLLNKRLSDEYSLKFILGAHSNLSLLFPKPGIDLKVKSSNYPRVDGMLVGRGWSDLSSYNATSVFYNWIELRTPVPFLESYFWLDFFLDAVTETTENGMIVPIQGGATIDSDKTQFYQMGLENFAFSTGVELRVNMAQLPLKFGLAKRFIVSGGKIVGIGGSIFSDEDDSTKGLSFFISLSTYSF